MGTPHPSAVRSSGVRQSQAAEWHMENCTRFREVTRKRLGGQEPKVGKYPKVQTSRTGVRRTQKGIAVSTGTPQARSVPESLFQEGIQFLQLGNFQERKANQIQLGCVQGL